MNNIICKYLALACVFVTVFSCTEEHYVPIETSPVVFDINEVPYETLSEYLFFEGPIANQEPSYGVLPFKPISKLFTDYAQKKRFVWMPENAHATYNQDHTILDFPDGAVLLKNFYYDNVQSTGSTKILETRMLIRKENTWVLANYVWNEAQTEAILDTGNHSVPIAWNLNGIDTSINYKIPSAVECLTCHKQNDNAIAIGVKPQNLNDLYTYKEGTKNQLLKWIEMGYLQEGLPENIQTIVDWDDATQPIALRARSYLDSNCAHCHSEGTHCSYRPLRFEFNDTTDPTNAGICVVPDENIGSSLAYVVAPGRSEKSVISYRLSSNYEEIRMPLIGRTIVHQEGVELINLWINSLTQTCE